MNSFISQPGAEIRGEIRVPGDKSVSHRAVMLGALATGATQVQGFLPGQDCLATLAAIQSMGVEVKWQDASSLQIVGAGLHGLKGSAGALDMGNSGTAMRLFAGLLCAQAFDSILVGDESLSRRPMERVAEPLRAMGAGIRTEDGHAPIRITGRQRLTGIDYSMPVASAQVKSALLLAGLYANGGTVVREPAITRDHTERMLATFGYPSTRRPGFVSIRGGGALHGTGIDVPGDLSSAAFLLLAGCIARRGELVIDHVGLNPTRTGILRILGMMGADIRVVPQVLDGPGEPAGRLIARPSVMRGVVIPPELVPLAIDEFPVIFAAAALADGETLITGAAELRHKESDRIRVMADGLRSLGVTVNELPDGARIQGRGELNGGEIDSRGDHRVAMAFAVSALRASGPVRILDTANVATSFPGFPRLARSIGLNVEESADA